MRKRILVLLVLIMSFMLIIPIEADALPSREINNNELSENVFMLTKYVLFFIVFYFNNL